jgi:hypothetical protein
MTEQKAALMEVGVLRNNREAVRLGKLPNRPLESPRPCRLGICGPICISITRGVLPSVSSISGIVIAGCSGIRAAIRWPGFPRTFPRSFPEGFAAEGRAGGQIFSRNRPSSRTPLPRYRRLLRAILRPEKAEINVARVDVLPIHRVGPPVGSGQIFSSAGAESVARKIALVISALRVGIGGSIAIEFS